MFNTLSCFIEKKRALAKIMSELEYCCCHNTNTCIFLSLCMLCHVTMCFWNKFINIVFSKKLQIFLMCNLNLIFSKVLTVNCTSIYLYSDCHKYFLSPLLADRTAQIFSDLLFNCAPKIRNQPVLNLCTNLFPGSGPNKKWRRKNK